jgi:hypothetical protein
MYSSFVPVGTVIAYFAIFLSPQLDRMGRVCGLTLRYMQPMFIFEILHHYYKLVLANSPKYSIAARSYALAASVSSSNLPNLFSPMPLKGSLHD